MRISFSKFSGSGNDFILVDNRENSFNPDARAIAKLCQRRTGIGADGIIFLEKSFRFDHKMRIFNADGSEAEMCGNGARCLLKFMRMLGIDRQKCLVETKESHIVLWDTEGTPCLAMPQPRDLQLNLHLNHEIPPIHYLNTGVPHAVIFVNNLTDEKWMNLAPSIRHHASFEPHGANVNFVQLDAQNAIHIRTYERGVEGETLACGTGSAAAALIASKLHHLPSPIKVFPRSQETLTITFNSSFTEVVLSGPATLIFQGFFTI